MRATPDSSNTYPFFAKPVPASTAISKGGFGVFHQAKQEFVNAEVYDTEPQAIAAAFEAKQAYKGEAL